MKISNYLIGVDSDGTAFDSMKHKHVEAFIPAALETWRMREPVAKRFAEIEQQVNLFSELRGINRFPCLLEVFERLEREFPQENGLPELADLREYVKAETTYSANSLRMWMQKHPSFELAKVLNWSNRADWLYANNTKGMMPFDGVKEALQAAAKEAGIVVISTARKASLEKDWMFSGLMSTVGMVMSQEDGSEEDQLRKAVTQYKEGTKVLMIGDTMADYAAAHAVGGRFYPIVPGDEAASWKKLGEEILLLFFSDRYTDEQEAACFEAFKAALE